MKTFLIFLTAILILSLSVSAQVPSKPFSIYANGGLSMVSGPEVFKDFHKLGFNLGAGIGFKAIPVVEIVLKGEYHSISKDWEFIDVLDGVSGGKVKFYSFGADARISSPSLVLPIKPFGFAGLGFAKLKQDEIVIDPLFDLGGTVIPAYEDKTKMYFNLGGGIEFGTGVKMFLQAKYMMIKTDGDDISFIPVSFGVKF
jgi:opacity protein-like surface antigen